MSEELPPLWALDKAAKAAGHGGWDHGTHPFKSDRLAGSIIAHARTIAQYEQPPVDEALEALARVLDMTSSYRGYTPQMIAACGWADAALAQFKRELEARK
jgi:hypothetical protein